MATKRLVVLTGPAGVGKQTLLAAARKRARFHEVHPFRTQPPWAPPPGSVPYRILSAYALEILPRERYVIGARPDQKELLDLDELDGAFATHDVVVTILYYTLIPQLAEHPGFQELVRGRTIEVRTVVVSPLSQEDLSCCPHLELVMPTFLQARQIRRALSEGTVLRPEVLAEITIRSLQAAKEMTVRNQCTDFLALYAGPGSPEWDIDPPAGDAGRALRHFFAILRGEAYV